MRPLAQGNRRNGNRRSGGRRLGRLFLFEPLEERKVLSASTGETASILASFNISTLASGRSLEIPTTSFVLPAELGTAVEESLPILGIPQMRLDPRFAGIDGTGTTVVIIDTGIDLNHPFFGPDSNNDGVADRIVYQYDFGGINGIPDSSANNSDTPETLGNTHGTHVSSIVASQDPNYPGVAPGVGIIHLKIFDDFGSATFGRLEQALQWVVQNAEAYNIVSVNMSVADGQTHEVPLVGQAAAIYGLSDELAALHDLGVVSVGAAGNRYLSVEGLAYPAADPKVISVGATHDVVLEEGFFFLFSLTRFGAPCIDCIAAFSQRHVNMLDVFAPGSPITAAQIVEMGDLTVAQHGTSQAAPMIAGMTALAQQLSLQVLGRKLDVEEFRGLLRNSSAIINDGDDEVDSVFNTGHNFRRADMQGLAAAIVELRDPQPVASGAVFANEGTPYSLVLSATQQGDGEIIEWTVDWGDGTVDVVDGSTTSLSHVFADGPEDYTVIATATDQYGSYAAPAVSVHVRNVAPELSISGAPFVLTGTSYAFSLFSVDIGSDAIASWNIAWGDGTVDEVVGNPATVHHTYQVPGMYEIVASATDEDGSYSANPKTVLAAPVQIAGGTSAQEGAAYFLNLLSSPLLSEPATEWLIDWGDGSDPEIVAAGVGSVSHVFADGPLNHTIHATATLGTLSYAANLVQVAVQNVSPTLTLSGPSTVLAGIAYPLSLGAVDPGNDTIAGWIVHWGDGTTEPWPGGSEVSATHVYAEPGDYQIVATAIDEDGTYDASTILVNVSYVQIAGTASVQEGSAYGLEMLSSAFLSEPLTQWEIDWGDGLGPEIVTGNVGSASRVFADGPSNRTVRASAFDGTTTYFSNELLVEVHNVAPTLTLDGPAVVNEGDVFTLELAVTDPGADTVSSWTINWGDGMTQVIEGNPSSVEHVYADDAANPYLILATATDEDGSYDALPFSVTVTNVAATVAIIGGTVVDEGSVYVLNFAATDPGDDTVSEWVIHWGDGSVDTILSQLSSLEHLYVDGADTHTVYAVATDEDGSFTSNEIEVTVRDVAPTLLISGASV
ncbi:MAG: PKD domain-containing protein, partial [Planctomycetota bacterium]|nr:PKD domain-containing protein [Planctomycetota bacterium]